MESAAGPEKTTSRIALGRQNQPGALESHNVKRI
jgi:hypothetical protein